MDVKTILLLITFMHTFTADRQSSERNFTFVTETRVPTENVSFPDGLFWNENYSNISNSLFPGQVIYNIIAQIPEELWPDNYQATYPCNLNDSVICNETRQIFENFTISKEAVLFLKGLLVTRVMPSFYILLFLISLPLNALALVTFICKIKAKKPAVIYMSHLACVDLLFTLLLPLKIHYYLNGSHWVFGEVACRVLSAVYYCYMYCSILLMMCMSVDRLVAVVFPVASLTWRSTRKSMCVCVLVWLLAIAGTAPLLSIQQTFKIENVGITCHDVLYHTQLYSYLFSVLSCLFFFLPLVVTLTSYSIVIYVLTVKSGHLATTSSTKRRRAVIMTIAVVTEFVMCFAPSNGILLYHCVILATAGHTEEGKYYMFAVCVGSSSVLLDPLLYYYGSSQCRQKISSVFWWKKTKHTSSNTHTQLKSSLTGAVGTAKPTFRCQLLTKS